MAELFTIIGEALVLLAEILAAWVHALFEGLVVLVCFLFSRKFRQERLETWKLHRRKKITDLGFAAIWFAGVVALPCFLFVPSSAKKPDGEPIDPTFVRANTNEDLRVELRTSRTNNQQTLGTVSVKKGGVAKILDTKSLGELKTQLVANVSFYRISPTNVNSTTNR